MLWAGTVHAQLWIGTGFDGMSQQYYLETTDSLGIPPESLAVLRQPLADVNEGRLWMRTRVGDHLSWDQTTALTSLSWQHRTTLTAKSDRMKRTRGRLEYRLNWKSPHETDETDVLSNFSVHEAEAEGEHRFGRMALRVDGHGEWVHYPDPGELAYDYQHYRGSVRLTHTSDLYHYREGKLTLTRRLVPDSARVSYEEASGQFALGFTAADLTFDSRLEGAARRYDDDLAHLDFEVGRWQLTWRDLEYPARWSGTLEAEGYHYRDTASPVTDFMRVIARPRRAFPLGSGWSPFVEPGLEVLFAETDVIDENYVEPRLALGSDYFNLDGWWGSADISTSYRNYRGADEDGLTDYWRFGINLFVDGRLTRNLSVNLLLAQDWEWHANSANDISVTLFTTGLSYKI